MLATVLLSPDKLNAAAFVFDETAATESFAKLFDSSGVTENFWKDMQTVEIKNSLTENHRHLIFGGRGTDGVGRYGTANDTHYTVNVQIASMPDLLADMNSIADLAHLPSERFDVVFATNIPNSHFGPTFFINARRLLVPDGVLIVNTLERYFPDEFGEMRRENRKEEIDACLALFGFTPILEQFDDYKPQLYSIGYEKDCFDDDDGAIIYRKI